MEHHHLYLKQSTTYYELFLDFNMICRSLIAKQKLLNEHMSKSN